MHASDCIGDARLSTGMTGQVPDDKGDVEDFVGLREELTMFRDKATAQRRLRAVTLIQQLLQDDVPSGAIAAPLNVTRAGISCNYGSLAHLAGTFNKTPSTPRLTGNVSFYMFFMINA